MPSEEYHRAAFLFWELVPREKIDKNFLKENQVIIFQQLSKYCKKIILDRKKISKWKFPLNYDGKLSCFLFVQPFSQTWDPKHILTPTAITYQAFSSKNTISISKEKLEIQLILSVLVKKITWFLTKGGTKLEKNSFL